MKIYLGTNEERMIAILSKRTFNQRVEIAKKFSASFGKVINLIFHEIVEYLLT